jgi:hypothetical protein
VGVVIVAVVLLDGPAERPAPGLHGDRLGVLLALVAFAVGLLGAREAVLRHAPLWVQVPLLFALVAGSGVLMWLQPGGPGFLGFFFLAAWVAALRVPARPGPPRPAWPWCWPWPWSARPRPTARSWASCSAPSA